MPANDSSRSAAAPRRYPLHVHIATLAIALIVLAGGVIGWFNYSQHARLVLAAADRVFDRLHHELVADLEQGSRHRGVVEHRQALGADAGNLGQRGSREKKAHDQ